MMSAADRVGDDLSDIVGVVSIEVAREADDRRPAEHLDGDGWRERFDRGRCRQGKFRRIQEMPSALSHVVEAACKTFVAYAPVAAKHGC
jgi:hypothetical protein